MLYLKSEAPLIQESWINWNIPFMAEKFVVVDEISESIKNKKIYDLMNNFNFGLVLSFSFIAAILVSYLLTTVLGIVDKTKKKATFKQLKYTLSKKFRINHWLKLPSVSAFGLFLVFLNFHFWFVQLIVLNNIKASFKLKLELLLTGTECC